MALTKVSRGLLSTGIVDNSNATAITLNADESATFAGNVGIGNSNSTYAMQVKKDIDAFAVKIENDGNSAGTSGNSYADASDGLWVDTRWNTATNTPFQVTTNSGGTPIIVAKGNGSVGIGVDNPSSYYGNDLVVGAAAEGGITIASTATTNTNYINFADSTSGVARYAGMIEYAHSLDQMSFRTNALDRMKIDNAGHAIIGGGITLGNGQTYAAANTISDYEEGGFSPAIVGGTQTITAIQQARYTKIGRSVLLNVYITQSTVTASTSLALSGLPFTATTYNATGIVNFATNSSGSPVLCRTVPNATRLMFYRCDVNQLSITQTQNAGHIIFSITYITDQ